MKQTEVFICTNII